MHGEVDDAVVGTVVGEEDGDAVRGTQYSDRYLVQLFFINQSIVVELNVYSRSKSSTN